LAADLAEQKAELEAKVKADAPKVEFHNKVTEAINCQTVEEVAKILGTGRNRLFAWLRDRKFFMDSNLPYQEYIDRGYFRVIERQFDDKRGESHTYTRTLVTGKGLSVIQKRFAEAA
jgi:anti-repressor protein